MSKTFKIPYKHENILLGITAFMGNIEKKLQLIVPGLPVFMLDTGDESYFQKFKYSSDNSQKDLYMVTPRFVVGLEDLLLQTEENTNQYNKFRYVFNNTAYRVKARRQATQITIKCDFVCSNVVKAIEYYELMASLMCVDNVFTYNVLGNTFQGSFATTIISMIKNTMDASSTSTKNYNVQCMVNLTLQPMFIRYETIEKLDDAVGGGGGVGDGGDNSGTWVSIFELDVYDPLYQDAINPIDPDSIKYDKNNPDKR